MTGATNSVLNLNLISVALCVLYFALPSTATTCSDLTLGYDAVYDFQNGYYCSSANVVVHQSFSGSGCSRRGVLKLVMNNLTRRRVWIDFYFNNPTEWVFNLGDSSTNNGWAGDAGTTRYDAEVQGHGRAFAGYRNDEYGSGKAFVQSNAYTTRLALLAENGKVTWLSDNTFGSIPDPGLFALNGQDNNYDLYLGLNKVVYGGRSGSGLCKAAIRFLP